jgi:hypothetical protein
MWRPGIGSIVMQWKLRLLMPVRSGLNFENLDALRRAAATIRLRIET